MGNQTSHGQHQKTGPEAGQRRKKRQQTKKHKKRRKKHPQNNDDNRDPIFNRGQPAGFQPEEDNNNKKTMTFDNLPDDLTDALSLFLTVKGLPALGNTNRRQQDLMTRILAERKSHLNFDKHADAMVYYPNQTRTSIPKVGYFYVKMDQKLYYEVLGDFRTFPDLRQAIIPFCGDPDNLNDLRDFFVACKLTFQPPDNYQPSSKLSPHADNFLSKSNHVFAHALSTRTWKKDLFYFFLTEPDNNARIRIDVLKKYTDSAVANQNLKKLALKQSRIEIDQDGTHAIPSATSEPILARSLGLGHGQGVFEELLFLKF